MTAFLTHWDMSAAAGWAVNVLAQVTAVVALAALLAWPARRHAAARHTIWLTALVCVLFSPLLAQVAPSVVLPVLAAEPPALAVEDESPPRAAAMPQPDMAKAQSAPSSVTAWSETADPPIAPVTEISEAVQPIPPAPPINGWRAGVTVVLLVWLAGMAFALLRLLHDLATVARLRHSARPLDGQFLDAVAADVQSALGRLPRIDVAPAVPVPVAVGSFRPAVLLSAGLAESLRPEQLRDVLIHEGAHLRRRDPLVGLLQRVAAALFWPHPLVHWLNRRLAQAREEVCDNYVLRRGAPAAYARTLLQLAERLGARRMAPALGLMGHRWRLEERIAGLLAPGRDRMTGVSCWTWVGVVGVLLAAGLGVAGVRLAAAPAQSADEPDDPSRAVIRGVVVDGMSRPVAGATVRTVWRGPHANPASTRTDADGRFRLVLDRPTVTHDLLIASDATGANQGLYRLSSDTPTTPPDVRVALRPSRPLTAHVTDSQGTPVSAATVVALDESLVALARTQTGADGTARLSVPADGRVIQVIAAKGGVGLDYFENYRTAPYKDRGELPAEVRLVLDGAQTVKVRATDRGGLPVPGVMTLPWYIHKPGKVYYFNGTSCLFDAATNPRTGPDGVAVIDWIPTELQEGVQFHCYSPAYHQPDVAFLAPGRRDVTLDVKLLLAARVSGRVTKPDGQPAPGIQVRAEGRGLTHNYGRQDARTAADGTYTILCPPEQSYIIAVIDKSWAAQSHTGILLREGEARDGLDFRLVPGTLLRGRVTSGTPLRPVAGHTVTLIQQGVTLPQEWRRSHEREDLPLWATTDAEGHYQFRVGPGEYRLYGDYGVTEPKTLTVQDEPTLTRDFHVEKRRFVAFTGVVRKADGTPVPKAKITGTVLGPVGGRFLPTIADDQGRFRTEQPPHRAIVYATDPAGTLAAFLVFGGDDAEVTVTLAPAAHTTGRLLGPDGKPRPHTRVCGLINHSDGRWGVSFPVREATTDAEGRFVLTGLASGGRYDLNAQLDGMELSEVTNFIVQGTDPIDLGDVTARPRKR